MYNDTFSQLHTLFQSGKKGIAIGSSFLFLTFFILFYLIRLYKNKQYNFFSLGVISILISILIINTPRILDPHKQFIITPFEMDALSLISQQNKDVQFITQNPQPTIEVYKSIKPLLFTNPKVNQWLTGKVWQEIPRENGKSFALKHYKNKLLAVPAYQGAMLYDGEIKKYNLNKILDNAQIQIYAGKND